MLSEIENCTHNSDEFKGKRDQRRLKVDSQNKPRAEANDLTITFLAKAHECANAILRRTHTYIRTHRWLAALSN